MKKLRLMPGALATTIMAATISTVPISHANRIIGKGEIAGHRVIRIYDDESFNLTLPNVRVIFQDRSGRYWVSVSGRLYTEDGVDHEWVSPDISFTWDVARIAQAEDGTLFLASRLRPLGGARISSFRAKEWLETGHPMRLRWSLRETAG